MRESIKSFLALLFVVGIVVTAFTWHEDRPDQTTWMLRIGVPIASLLILALLLRIHLRRDTAPDYLRSIGGSYFNRDGFCFTFTVDSLDDTAYIGVFFQSQFDRPSIGRIALRPAEGFFLTRAKMEVITFEIECPPSGFGFVRMAFPIPPKLQGKKQRFEVGASVKYPLGKGRRVRFHDGIFLRANSNFGDAFTTAIALAGTVGGGLVLSRPAEVTIPLPSGVADSVDENLTPQLDILWQQGDLQRQIGA